MDVGARATLYGLMRDLCSDAAVIVMSSDCDEVFGLADRMTALYRGRMIMPPDAAVARDAMLSAGLTGMAA